MRQPVELAALTALSRSAPLSCASAVAAVLVGAAAAVDGAVDGAVAGAVAVAAAAAVLLLQQGVV